MSPADDSRASGDGLTHLDAEGRPRMVDVGEKVEALSGHDAGR